MIAAKDTYRPRSESSLDTSKPIKALEYDRFDDDRDYAFDVTKQLSAQFDQVDTHT